MLKLNNCYIHKNIPISVIFSNKHQCKRTHEKAVIENIIIMIKATFLYSAIFLY